MYFRSRVVLVLLLLFPGVVYSQASSGSIHGSVLLPGGAPLTGAVKITLEVLRGDQLIAYTDQEGRFEFQYLTAGEYTIEAESDRDRKYDPGSERILVRRGVDTFVTIYLKEKS